MTNIVEILVTARNLARPALDEATANARGLGGVMGKMAQVSTVALAGIAVASVKMAGDFESSTTRLITSAGESHKNIDMVRKGMLDMAGQVGYSANELAKGMYTVESAGYHGADGLKVLKAAAQGAKDENADLGTVANAVTDALTDYHLKASDSANVTSQLVKAVSFGKTTFEEFSGSMSTVLPLAGTLHIKLADVTGVMATMTAHGVSAAQASQNIANAMRHLASPTGTMEDEFKKLGISTKEVTEKLSKDGLQGTMEFLSKTAEKAGKIGTPAYTQALYKLMGSAAGLNVALQTTGENSAQAQKAIKGIGEASADSKGNVEGFSDMQKTFKQRVDQLKASFESLMITIGNKLMPIMSGVVDFFNKHQTVFEVLLGTIGGLIIALTTYSLVMKTVELVTAAWTAAQWLLNAAMDANPIGLVVLAIAALAAGLVYAWKHSETFRNVVKDTFDGVKVAVSFAIGIVLKVLKGLVDAWLFMAGEFLHGAAKAFGWIPGIGSKLKAADRAFGDLRRGVDDKFNAMIHKTDDWRKSAEKAFVERHLKANISDWQSKLDAAKKKLATVPNSKKAALLADIKDLQKKIRAAKESIDSLHNKVVTITYNGVVQGTVSNHQYTSGLGYQYAHGGVVGAAASGGSRNGLVLVGEHGPELVKLPSGSTVHSNPDTQRMFGMGRQAHHVVLEIHSGGSRLDDAIVEIIRKSVRTRGGNVQLALGRN